MGINIIIADDHPFVRYGYKSEFDKVPNLNIVGVAANGIELLNLYEELRPDITILDISMPSLNGIEAALEILKINKNSILLFCSVTTQKSEIYKTYKVGGKGFISKEKPLSHMVKAVNEIYQGKLFFDDVFTKQDFEHYSKVNENIQLEGKELTEREKDVLRFMAQNFTNKEIAAKLFVSERTIEQRRRRMRAKLGLSGYTELIRYAIEFSKQ